MADQQDIIVGKRFKKFRKEIGQSQEMLALQLDVSQSYIAGIEIGRNPVPTLLARTMMNIYDLSLDWLMTGNGPMYVHERTKKVVTFKGNLIREKGNLNQDFGQNVMLVPVLAQAGFLGNWTQEWIDQNLVKTSIPGVDGPAFAFEVEGDSMLPTIHPGDYIVGTKLERKEDVRESRVHIVISRTSGIYIKRVYHDNTLLILESDNDRYPPVALPGDDVMAIYYAIQRLTGNFSGPRPFTSRLDRMEDFLANKFPEFKGQGKGDE